MPSLLEQMDSASTCAVMNVLDDEGNPKGLTKFDVALPEFIFQSEMVNDTDGIPWTVTFNKSVLNKIHLARDEYLPAEAAGYLLGLYNINTHRISITVATVGHFTSSPSTAKLESIELDDEAQSVLADSNYMLKPLGTWHSHPGRSAQPSPIDLTTFRELSSCNERVLPTIMMICADDEIHFLVGMNRYT